MKKIKYTLPVMLVLIGAVFVTSITAQVPLSDPNDSMRVTNPRPNQLVKNNVNTKFTLVDDDRNNIPYEVSLKNNRCTTTISVIDSGNAVSGQEKTVTWPSAGPLPSVANVADGTYCMEVCATMRNGNKNYSACNSRYVIIRNNNAAPRITTNVPSGRTIYADGTFRYDVNASDADGDKLTFSLTRAPRFLSINSYTGLISTNGNAKSLGSHTVEVRVTDGFGGSDVQKFTIQVIARPTPPPTSSSSSSATSSVTSSAQSTTSQTTSQTSSSTSSDGIDPDDVKINFTAPEAGAQLSGSENVVAWTVEGLPTEEISEIKISLLYDNNVETLENLQPTATSYNFDATRFGPTDYRFQLDIVTESQTFTAQSPNFSVVAEGDNGGETDSRPLIVNIQPEENAITTELRPTIRGEFVVAEGATINLESFELIFNNTKRNWCEVTQEGFTCVPDTDLRDGVQNVQIGVQDNQSRQGAKLWTFEVEDPNTDGQVDEDRTVTILGLVVPVNTLFLVLAICGALIILLLLPWILYVIWRRRDDGGRKQTSNNGGGSDNGGSGSSATSTGGDENVSYLVPITEQYGQDAATTDVSDFEDPNSTYVAIDVPDYGVDLSGTNNNNTPAIIEPTTPEPQVPAMVEQPSAAPDAATTNPSTATAGTGQQTGAIDPLNFDNYEDYLAAVGSANSTDSNTAVPANTPESSTTTPNTTPDYSDLYTASPTENPTDGNSDSNTQNTDWTQPVQS